MSHLQIDSGDLEGAFVNSKGFGGNNATGFFMSPQITEKMLTRRWGDKHMRTYHRLHEEVTTQATAYDDGVDEGEFPPIYSF